MKQRDKGRGDLRDQSALLTLYYFMRTDSRSGDLKGLNYENRQRGYDVPGRSSFSLWGTNLGLVLVLGNELVCFWLTSTSAQISFLLFVSFPSRILSPTFVQLIVLRI